jgi:predicted nucleotidyltransferase component of viral defense system
MIDKKHLASLQFSEYQIQKTILMSNIAEEISSDEKSALILKGGTALLLCYNLPRFSTDLDYDGVSYDVDIVKNIENGVKKSGLTISDVITKKNTDTVKRFMLHCEETPFDPLKIEISLRNKDVILNDKNCFTKLNDIIVYKISHLAAFKVNAFLNRTTARDVFDLAFLIDKYPDAISDMHIKSSCEKFKSVGMGYYENLMKSDEIIKNIDYETILLKLHENLNQRSLLRKQSGPSLNTDRKQESRRL